MSLASSVSEKKLSSGNADKAFLEAKIATARFYSDNVLVQASGLRDMVVKGGGDVMALSDEQFLAA